MHGSLLVFCGSLDSSDPLEGSWFNIIKTPLRVILGLTELYWDTLGQPAL